MVARLLSKDPKGNNLNTYIYFIYPKLDRLFSIYNFNSTHSILMLFEIVSIYNPNKLIFR